MSHDHDEGSENSCPMMMIFHARGCETILWKEWTVNSLSGFILTAIAIFLIAFCFEGLKYLREKLYLKFAKEPRENLELRARFQENGACCTENAQINKKSIIENIFQRPHLIQVFLHLLQVLFSYTLMLIFMTYNYWLCLAILLGSTLGYLCFGWIKQQSVAYNEHCH